jgi:16S rRNA processing protein RimM
MRGSDRIEVGGIARAHGIRGEVVVHLHDPESTVLEDAATLWVAGRRCEVEKARPGPHGWLVKLASVPDRNAAELLRGSVVEVDRDAIEVGDDEVLLDDLIGCSVRRVDGSPWGVIVAIDFGAQDRLIIHDGEVERQLPLVDAFVVGIDVDAGMVTVDPPDGLPESPVERDRRAPR